VSIETLLAIFVAITAIAVGLQSVFMTIAARSILKLIEKLEQRVDRFELDTQELIDRARTVVGCAEPIGRIAEDVSTTVNRVSEMITTRVSSIDQFVEETIQFGREQSSKLDHVVTDTVGKFERATKVIQKDVAQPVAEIFSIFQGIRVGLAYFLNRKASTTSRGENHSDEEEMFI